MVISECREIGDIQGNLGDHNSLMTMIMDSNFSPFCGNSHRTEDPLWISKDVAPYGHAPYPHRNEGQDGGGGLASVGGTNFMLEAFIGTTSHSSVSALEFLESPPLSAASQGPVGLPHQPSRPCTDLLPSSRRMSSLPLSSPPPLTLGIPSRRPEMGESRRKRPFVESFFGSDGATSGEGERKRLRRTEGEFRKPGVGDETQKTRRRKEKGEEMIPLPSGVTEGGEGEGEGPGFCVPSSRSSSQSSVVEVPWSADVVASVEFASPTKWVVHRNSASSSEVSSSKSGKEHHQHKEAKKKEEEEEEENHHQQERRRQRTSKEEFEEVSRMTGNPTNSGVSLSAEANNNASNNNDRSSRDNNNTASDNSFAAVDASMSSNSQTTATATTTQESDPHLPQQDPLSFRENEDVVLQENGHSLPEEAQDSGGRRKYRASSSGRYSSRHHPYGHEVHFPEGLDAAEYTSGQPQEGVCLDQTAAFGGSDHVKEYIRQYSPQNGGRAEWLPAAPHLAAHMPQWMDGRVAGGVATAAAAATSSWTTAVDLQSADPRYLGTIGQNHVKWLDQARPGSAMSDAAGGCVSGSSGGGVGSGKVLKYSPSSSSQDLIPDDTLANLSVKELNKRVQNYPREEIVALKQRRRTLKNRG